MRNRPVITDALANHDHRARSGRDCHTGHLSRLESNGGKAVRTWLPRPAGLPAFSSTRASEPYVKRRLPKAMLGPQPPCSMDPTAMKPR